MYDTTQPFAKRPQAPASFSTEKHPLGGRPRVCEAKRLGSFNTRFLGAALLALSSLSCSTTIGGDDPDNMSPGSVDGGQDVGTEECPGGEQAFTALMTEVQSIVDSANAPGLALAILCNGKLAHTAAIGSVRDNGAAIDENTRFQLASATKMFTAAAALRLANQGTVALDAPITQYIPELTFGRVSLEELLSHSSGFSTVFDANIGGGLVDVVRENASMALWSDPGAVWNYSNTGMAVAGAVLEVASGRSFATLIEEEVFAPSRMTSASMSVEDILAGGNFAYGHEGTASSPREVAPDGSYFGAGEYGPMGGAWGSVVDLARWAEAHMASDDPLGAGLTSSLRTPRIRTTSSGQSYGLGHFIQDSDPASISHGGSTVGFLTDFTIYPESGFGVVVLSNSEWFDPYEVTQLAEAKYLGEVGYHPLGPENGTRPQLVGSYNSSAFGQITIREAAQGLEAVFVDRGITSPLQHWWGDSYGVDYGSEGEIDFNFWREPGQNASHIVSLYGVAKRN